MAGVPDLDDLIRSVTDAVAGEPLERLAEAARRKGQLDELADALLGHFVEQARLAGCSWSQIGEALGVSKQAAQQRHAVALVDAEAQTSLLQDLSRFTERARRCITEAQTAATRLQHNYVGTEHLLLGLLAVADGIAAKILVERGLSAELALGMVRDHVGEGGAPVVAPGPFTPRAVNCLAAALREALAMGHNYIGTEHLLLGLYTERQAIGAKVLRQADIDKKDVRAAVIQVLSGHRITPPGA